MVRTILLAACVMVLMGCGGPAAQTQVMTSKEPPKEPGKPPPPPGAEP